MVAAVERGMLLELDAYVKRDAYDLTDFRKDAVELYRWKGGLCALPRAYGLQLAFYNDELKEGSTTPVRISISTSPEYITPPHRGARSLADGQEFVVRDPVHTRWPDVERDVVNTVLNEQLWTGKATAAQATRQIKELGDPYFKS